MPRNARNACYLSLLGGRTDYFQKVYGVYFALPTSAINNKMWHRPTSCWVCEELELMDSDWTHLPAITDNLILESCIGIWAASHFANMNMGDEKFDNYAVKTVSFYRCYHYGQNVFTFPPGMMAKRIDLHDGQIVVRNLKYEDNDNQIATKMNGKSRAHFPFQNYSLAAGTNVARQVLQVARDVPDELFDAIRWKAAALNVNPPHGAPVVHYSLDD